MKQFMHATPRRKSHRILPGHARSSRFTQATALPGVDGTERQARRSTWTDRQAARRFQYGLGGSVGLIGAVLALTIALFAAIGPRTNVLDTATHAEGIQLVDAAPLVSTNAATLRG